jgi:glucokinase
MRDLAAGAVNVVNLLNPDVLVVGGGISREGEKIIRPLRESVSGTAI